MTPAELDLAAAREAITAYRAALTQLARRADALTGTIERLLSEHALPGTPKGGYLNAIGEAAATSAHNRGYKDEPFPTRIALTHRELSEALQRHREGSPLEHYPCHDVHCLMLTELRPFADDTEIVTMSGALEKPFVDPDLCDCNPKPEGHGVEQVDALLYILGTLHTQGADIDGILTRVMAYNKTRPPNKKEH